MKKSFSLLPEDKKAQISAKFWGKVARSGPAECWLWQGPRNKSGYGYVWFCGTVLPASRAAYILTHGDIPQVGRSRQNVCHTCDNPPCCNPAHLFVGSGRENVIDARKKGRHLGKLTADDVREVRRIATTPTGIKACAALFNVHPGTIRQIVNRKSWAWLD